MKGMNFQETLKFLPVVHKTPLVPFLVGHTGIGKTELAMQYANSIGYKLIVLHVAQLEPSDFIGLYKTTPDGRTMTCPPNWLPYIEDTTKMEVKGNGTKGFIVLLDEINRGHEDIRQALYEFLQTKCIHTYQAPENTYIIATGNPSDLYETNEFDDALINRFAIIKFQPELSETLTYLKNKHGSSLILSWANGEDKSILDMGEDNYEVKGQKFSPRMLDYAITMYEELQTHPDKFVMKALETIMPDTKVSSFMAFLEELKHISHVDVINGDCTKKVEELLKMHRRDVLSVIVDRLAEVLKDFKNGQEVLKDVIKGVKVENDIGLANAANFLKNCPAELCSMFLNLFQDNYDLTKPTCVLSNPVFKKPLADKMGKFQKVIEACKSESTKSKR